MTDGTVSPTVRLANPDVLAAEARRDTGLRALVRLAEWACGRRVTRRGVLTLAEARRAVAALHLPGDQGPDVAPARSAEDFDELHEQWCLTLDSGLLDVHDTRAEPGPVLERFREGTDAAVLTAWSSVFVTAMENVLAGGSATQLGAMMRLYLGLAPVPMVELVRDAVMVMDAEAVPVEAEQDVLDMVDLLTRTGVASADDDGVQLLPLGVFGVNQVLQLIGVDAPTVTDLASAGPRRCSTSPARLQTRTRCWPRSASGRRHESRGRPRPSWSSTPRQVVPWNGPACSGLLNRLGNHAEGAVRAVLDEPGIEAHASAWLATHGYPGTELTVEQVQWLLVDSMIAARDEHPELVDRMFADLSGEVGRSPRTWSLSSSVPATRSTRALWPC